MLVGTFSGTLFFSSGVEEQGGDNNSLRSTVLRSEGRQSIFLSKFDSMGQFQWATGVGGPQSIVCPHKHYLAIDRTHNWYYIAGCFNGTISFYDNPNTTNVGSLREDVVSLRVDKWDEKEEIGEVPIIPSRGECASVRGGGETASKKQWRLAHEDESRDCRAAPRTPAASPSSAPSLSPSPAPSPAKNISDVGVTLTNSDGTAIYVAGYNSSGQFNWANKVGVQQGKYGCALAADNSGNVFIMGFFTTKASFTGQGTLPSLTSTHNTPLTFFFNNRCGCKYNTKQRNLSGQI